ncbi:nitrogen fixation protein NifZ [Thiorhodospira sibirica]|uniref:nitrogen fixation protein NifZ n=1 Tax=Thiorhodospira sibirica TaxID=154347 RepID=UPI00022C057B|nr:nitrogen fixation protein NifZ [Thiorhodospira sibirica]
MRARFDYGQAVRLRRNVRNDGSYPGIGRGELLIPRGSIGHIIEMGLFLQTQIIYSVHFLEQGRVIGCREEELLNLEQPWHPSRFAFRDKVKPTRPLAIDGEVIATPEDIGEVIKVLADDPQNCHYHVHFHGRTLQLGEALLCEAEHV